MRSTTSAPIYPYRHPDAINRGQQSRLRVMLVAIKHDRRAAGDRRRRPRRDSRDRSAAAGARASTPPSSSWTTCWRRIGSSRRCRPRSARSRCSSRRSGLFGLLSYRVARRTNEIGVRLAFGATRGAVLRMVLGESGRLIAAGLVVGVIAAVMLARFVSSRLLRRQRHRSVDDRRRDGAADGRRLRRRTDSRPPGGDRRSLRRAALRLDQATGQQPPVWHLAPGTRHCNRYTAAMIQAALLSLLLDEASVRSIHAALDARKVTCVQVVRHYLDRIDAYDDRGPASTPSSPSIRARWRRRRKMDRLDRATRAQRPLHCIPVVLKDNFHTADMPTTGGSKTFAKHADAGRWLRRQEAARCRRHHHRQGQPARAGARGDDRQLARRADQESVRPHAHTRRIERRHRRGDRRELRRARHRQRHRTVDQIAVVRERPRRPEADTRPRQPRRRHAVQHDAG